MARDNDLRTSSHNDQRPGQAFRLWLDSERRARRYTASMELTALPLSTTVLLEHIVYSAWSISSWQ